MKVNTINDAGIFQPITLQITIETIEERDAIRNTFGVTVSSILPKYAEEDSLVINKLISDIANELR
jgi:hypothetical protein